MAHCSRISVLFDRSDDSFTVYTAAVKIPFRPPKLPYVRTLPSARLNDTPLLRGLPP
jgi:hypothetical protein